MVEYVGVIRKEVVSAMTPSGPQLQYVMGGKENKHIQFTPQTYQDKANRKVSDAGFNTKWTPSRPNTGNPNRKTIGVRPPSKQNLSGGNALNPLATAERGSRFANTGQRWGQGLGMALGGLAGMMSLANAGAQGQDLISGALSAGQTGKFVSDAVSPTLGNVAGKVGGNIGVATAEKPKAPVQVQQNQLSDSDIQSIINQKPTKPDVSPTPGIVSANRGTAHTGDTSSVAVKPFSQRKPVAVDESVRATVREQEGRTGIDHSKTGFDISGFGTKNIGSQRPLGHVQQGGKTSSNVTMFDDEWMNTPQGQATMQTANQPAAASLPTAQQVPVTQPLPATAPMDTTNVQPVAPVQVTAPTAPMTQTSAETVLQADPFAQGAVQETEVQEAEGGVDALAEQKKHEAALLSDPYANQNASATTHGLDKSTNPRRFVGVI